MTRLLLWLALPCLYWTQGPQTAPTLTEAGIAQVCVPADQVESWRTLSVSVTPIAADDLAKREPLLPPGTVPRAGLASPTRSPWVNANGWRFARSPRGRYVYDLPAGKGALGAAEALAYDADAVLKIAPEDLPAVARMFAFAKRVPVADLPALADFGVVDDGSPELGEVMNLLVRRNLLFQRLSAPSPRFPLNVKLGTKEYARETAADPSAFALTIRRQLTDERRSLRIYGSEVVIARLTADATRARVHLINYGGRNIEGLRVRVRGSYASAHAYIAGADEASVTDHAVADGYTEFSLPRMSSYAVVDLK